MTSHMPKRHHSLLHRHYSTRSSKTDLTPDPNVFDGTDSITAHKRVALSRVIEAHDALAAQNRNSAPKTEPPAPDDPSAFEFDSFLTSLPNGEVRIFKYLLRKWDHNQYPDPELEEAIAAFRPQFEEAAVKHFFRRITLWNESEEMMAAAKQGLQKDSKIIRRTSLGKMWWRERTRPDAEQSARDELKQVTTREGLAQLLWTLLNDMSAPLTPELFEECKNAVKKMYGIQNVDMDRPKS